jgi:hypothetical protein
MGIETRKPKRKELNMTTTTKQLSRKDLDSMTKAQIYDALEKELVTFAVAKPRLNEIEREEQNSAYNVKLGSTGRFFVSGPACSQSLTAGQVLGILSMKDRIVTIAKQHANAKPRLEELKNSKGETYGAWFQGDCNVASESTSNVEGILKSLAAL